MTSLPRREMFDRNEREREQLVAQLRYDLEERDRLIVAYLNKVDGAKQILDVAEVVETHLTTHEEGECAWERHYRILIQKLRKIIK